MTETIRHIQHSQTDTFCERPIGPGVWTFDSKRSAQNALSQGRPICRKCLYCAKLWEPEFGNG